jgi:ligand-binding sensor domain-containing protein/two-component sensor histidine kinase
MRKPRVKILAACLAVLVCAARSAHADEPASPPSTYVQEEWTSDELPELPVKAIVQTRDGYLWMAAWGGLIRFDGLRFTRFQDAGDDLPLTDCSSMLEDRQGNLWIGTVGGGLLRYRDGRFTRWTKERGLGSDIVHALLEDRVGTLWIGTSGGLNRLRDGRLSLLALRDGLPADLVTSLAAGARGEIWVGTGNGLARWQQGRFTAVPDSAGPPVRSIERLAVDRSGTLWIGTAFGLYRLAPSASSLTPEGPMTGKQLAAVSSFLEDRSGRMWVGGETLRLWHEGRWQPLAAESLEGKSGAALLEDDEGGLWFKLRDRLVRLHRQPGFEKLSEDLWDGGTVRAMVEDRRGDLWIATGKGLARRSQAGVEHFTTRQGLADANVLSLFEDRDGVLWIGTHSGLSSRLPDGRIRPLGAGPELRAVVLSIAQDDEGALWAGAWGGVYRIAGERIEHIKQAQGLADDQVTIVRRGGAGEMWIGTTRGLSRFVRGRLTSFPGQRELAGTYIQDLAYDPDGTLWIGSKGRGLLRLRRGRLTRFTARAGLPDNEVGAIVDDGRGSLWLSCRRGNFGVSRRALEAQADGRLRRFSGKLYDKSNAYVLLRSRDGRLWFGDDDGVVGMDPTMESRVPRVAVEELLANGALVGRGPASALPPETRRLEIRYTAISFTEPQNVHFRYRLEGFDPQWVEAGGERIATYTNLPPGRYKFRLSGASGTGPWTRKEAAVAFAIAPHFYQTGWFFAVVAAVVLGSVWGAYRLRVAHLEARSAVLEERNRLAGEVHDTLAQDLVGMVRFLDRAETEAPEPLREQLRRIREVARASLAEARRAIRALHSDGGETPELLPALREAVERAAAPYGATVEVRPVGLPRRLPWEIEGALLRIASEASVNAARHGEARRIEIEIVFAAQAAALTIADNGSGFDTTLRKPGSVGLLVMRERTERLGGSFAVDSRPGEGTRIRAEVPLAS